MVTLEELVDRGAQGLPASARPDPVATRRRMTQVRDGDLGSDPLAARPRHRRPTNYFFLRKKEQMGGPRFVTCRPETLRKRPAA